MTSVDEDSDRPVSQEKREALKKFARYAALAPTVVVLLQPHEGQAGRSRGGRERGGDSQY
jgi:hypothetical protein